MKPYLYQRLIFEIIHVYPWSKSMKQSIILFFTKFTNRAYLKNKPNFSKSAEQLIKKDELIKE